MFDISHDIYKSLKDIRIGNDTRNMVRPVYNRQGPNFMGVQQVAAVSTLSDSRTVQTDLVMISLTLSFPNR